MAGVTVVTRLVYAPFLSKVFHRHRRELFSSYAARRGWLDYSLVQLQPRTALDANWSSSYAFQYNGHDVALVCGISDAEVSACIGATSQQLPGGLCEDAPVFVWRVSKRPWDSVARIRGWSSGFRCDRDLAMAAQERGLATQAIVAPAVNEIPIYVAGHEDAAVVTREATYLALSGLGRPLVRPVGQIGMGGKHVLDQILAYRRMFEPAEIVNDRL